MNPYLEALGYIETELAKAQRECDAKDLPLGKKQERFSLMWIGLGLRIMADGNTMRHGETTNLQGKGHIKNSTHYHKCGGDALLFIDGEYITDTPSYKKYGEWWEYYGGSWGGHFGDGNHFSIMHNGVK